MGEVRKQASQYVVSVVPEDHPHAEWWEIVVERRRQDDGSFLWAVRRPQHRMTLNEHGSWDHDQTGAGWLDSHRFDEDEALRLAEEVAPYVQHRGEKAKDVQ